MSRTIPFLACHFLAGQLNIWTSLSAKVESNMTIWTHPGGMNDKLPLRLSRMVTYGLFCGSTDLGVSIGVNLGKPGLSHTSLTNWGGYTTPKKVNKPDRLKIYIPLHLKGILPGGQTRPSPETGGVGEIIPTRLICKGPMDTHRTE